MFDPVDALLADFDSYLMHFEEIVARGNRWGGLHRETIDFRRQFPSAVQAVKDSNFMSKLRSTLASKSGFGLARTKLHKTLVVNIDLHKKIEKLEKCRIESATSEDLEVLWSLVRALKINSAKAKLVANTKALAHVLTELVVPIDRAYTGAFLFRFASEFDEPKTKSKGHNRKSQEKEIFDAAFSAFQRIAKKICLSKYVSADGWNTTEPKVIDNAIIGFVSCVRKGLKPRHGPPR